MPVSYEHESAWCENLERLLRQRRIRLRSRRIAPRGYVYAVESPGGRGATVRVPRGAVATGIYGLNAALAEIEDALGAATTAATRSR